MHHWLSWSTSILQSHEFFNNRVNFSFIDRFVTCNTTCWFIVRRFDDISLRFYRLIIWNCFSITIATTSKVFFSLQVVEKLTNQFSFFNRVFICFIFSTRIFFSKLSFSILFIHRLLLIDCENFSSFEKSFRQVDYYFQRKNRYSCLSIIRFFETKYQSQIDID